MWIIFNFPKGLIYLKPTDMVALNNSRNGDSSVSALSKVVLRI